jgi:hypothetical protein
VLAWGGHRGDGGMASHGQGGGRQEEGGDPDGWDPPVSHCERGRMRGGGPRGKMGQVGSRKSLGHGGKRKKKGGREERWAAREVGPTGLLRLRA